MRTHRRSGYRLNSNKNVGNVKSDTVFNCYPDVFGSNLNWNDPRWLFGYNDS